jgi:hypothetical protein
LPQAGIDVSEAVGEALQRGPDVRTTQGAEGVIEQHEVGVHVVRQGAHEMIELMVSAVQALKTGPLLAAAACGVDRLLQRLPELLAAQALFDEVVVRAPLDGLAVHVRHPVIEQHQVDRLPLQSGQRFKGRCGLDHAGRGNHRPAKLPGEVIAVGAVVVGNQYDPRREPAGRST